MGKPKHTKKKRSTGNLKQASKPSTTKKTISNPFEIHINRQKHVVLGRKLKNDKGLPGVSRAKALKKRKATLLQEYKLKNKCNKFVDRRIGEKNYAMTNEDRITARFAAEQAKGRKRKMFNLGDDEILTHKGQTLSEIEKFDDPRSDDEEEDSGKLEASFVGEAHFGGGFLRKKENDENSFQSRQNLIQQLIAESKKRKAEKQKESEKVVAMTEKLDADWKELQSIVMMGKSGASKNDKSDEPVKLDSYDKAIREMKFESKGKPSDRLKSEDELALEERNKLEMLEAERIKRMHGDSEYTSVMKHQSADDLDDRFEVENVEENDETTSFQISTYASEDCNETASTDDDSGDDSDGDDESCDMADDLTDMYNIDSDDSTEHFSEKKIKVVKNNQKAGSGDGSGINNTNGIIKKTPEENIDTEEENLMLRYSSSEESLSASDSNNIEACDASKNVKMSCAEEVNVLREDTTVSGDGFTLTFSLNDNKQNHRKENDETDRDNLTMEADCDAEKIVFVLLEKEIEQAKKELPYTFEVPETYEQLQQLFADRNPIEQAIILERMIKCNHPSLKSGNRERLESLFAFLLQWIHDTIEEPECMALSSSNEPEFVLLPTEYLVMGLLPVMFDLVQLVGADNAHQCLSTAITEKYEEWQQKECKQFPNMDMLIFFQIIPHFFPASDFYHPVITPAAVMIAHIFEKCSVQSVKDLCSGIYLCRLLLQYTAESHRYLPEIVIFLQDVITLAIKRIDENAYKKFCLSNRCRKISSISQEFIDTLTGDNTNFDLALESTLNLFERLAVHLVDKVVSASFIISPVLQMLQYAEAALLVRYPKSVNKIIKRLINLEFPCRLEKLMSEKKKPRPLKMFEPAVEKITEGRRREPMSEKKRENLKLRHKYKREMKGAIREIRRDRSFIAKLRLKETMKSDAERNEKVKSLMSSLAIQAGEVNKLDRQKKRKK